MNNNNNNINEQNSQGMNNTFSTNVWKIFENVPNKKTNN